ncbi:MAG: hypothetical protein R3D63_04140 [Paracoccaceae bacterium]
MARHAHYRRMIGQIMAMTHADLLDIGATRDQMLQGVRDEFRHR